MRLPPGEKKPPIETSVVELKLEKDVVEKLHLMESHTGMSRHELVNIAMKRFISQHKDYLPPSGVPD